MCDYKILAHSQDGYVILCNSCGHYQLAYGTTAVTFEQEDFLNFCGEAAKLKTGTDCNGFEKQKRISLNIHSKCSMMILSYSELITLNDLLNEALFTCEMETMLEELKLIRG